MPNLILIPTELEAEVLRHRLERSPDWMIAVVGFGPIAAASISASLIAEHQPERVCLIGIAGAFDDESLIGKATRFGRVRCHGIGVRSGADYQNATEMGWRMVQQNPIGEEIELDNDSPQTLLTCCAASADNREMQCRQAAYPDAIAEDMEGFAVALSCKLANVSLEIVRGFSNIVGDRDHSNWRINEALDAASDLALEEVLS